MVIIDKLLGLNGRAKYPFPSLSFRRFLAVSLFCTLSSFLPFSYGNFVPDSSSLLAPCLSREWTMLA